VVDLLESEGYEAVEVRTVARRAREVVDCSLDAVEHIAKAFNGLGLKDLPA
jgi:hypothetical protein